MESNAANSDDGLTAERRAQLRAVKLGALVRSHLGVDAPASPPPSSPSSSAVGGVSALLVEGRAYGLAEELPDLGRLLHWAVRRQSAADHSLRLTIFAESAAAPDIARRASLLAVGAVDVFEISGADVAPAAAGVLEPPPVLDAELWQAASAMADAGARVVDDHGRLVADVMGLEVARLTSDGMSIGVGEADRELQGYVLGHLDQADALARAVTTVRSLRPVPSHPLNRLARPRWLRSTLLADPTLVGLGHLEPLPPLQPIEGVFDREPAAAYSPGTAGEAGATVVCSTGVDLNLIPEALDYRQRTDPESRLLLVLPERDQALAVDPLLPVLADAGFVDQILEVRSIQVPWESVRS